METTQDRAREVRWLAILLLAALVALLLIGMGGAFIFISLGPSDGSLFLTICMMAIAIYAAVVGPLRLLAMKATTDIQTAGIEPAGQPRRRRRAF